MGWVSSLCAIKTVDAAAKLIPSSFRDRRGITSLVFAVSATSMIGLASLATEGGTWYLERRHGQNAADAAATAGLVALANGQSVTTSGTATAALNGYTTGVTIYNPPPAGWAYAGNTSAVGVLITKVEPGLFSKLFMGYSPTMTERSVSVLMNTGGSVCALAGAGGMSFSGNTTISASGCMLGSNDTSTTSISFDGSSSVIATSLTSVGGCSGCSGSGATLSYPPLTYQIPTLDPFATAEAIQLPSFQGSTCRSMPNLNGATATVTALAPSTTQAFCQGQDLKLTNGNTVNLSPGTYFFYNSNITLLGGTLQCPTCTATNGVTIIMTGSNSGANTGTINISGNATVTLNAPVTNSWNSAFNGILIYRDSRAPATGNGGSAAVSINGGPSTILTGGLAFPSSDVSYRGNTASSGGPSLSQCTEIIAYHLTFSGSSTVDISNCAAGGTAVAQTRSVQTAM
jgi:hypothetical protein